MNPMSLWNRMLSLHLYLNHHVVSRRSHTVELLLGGQRLLLIFPLAQDRSSFLGELSQRRASLEGLKMVALPWPCTPCPHQGQHTEGEDQLIHSDQEGNFFRLMGLFSLTLFFWHGLFDTSLLLCSQAVTDPETSAVVPVPGNHTAPAGRLQKHFSLVQHRLLSYST